MSILDFLLGRELRSSDERAEQVGPARGIPIFGLDALSSAGYGPEAALTLLIPLGAAGLEFILPITGAIVVLLLIVYASYLQTIEAYPGGGGSYTVARENLGESAGLLAACALMIDYVLTAAVGIAAGVGALVSAAPGLQPYTLTLCLAILFVVAFVNLRGTAEAGTFFMIPTYLFIGTLAAAIAAGLARLSLSGGHPVPSAPLPPLRAAAGTAGAWVLLQAFASGCTAMTGVEAVSNGVRAFREPAVKNAKTALTVIIAILVSLLLGVAYLAKAYGVVATDPGRPGYQSVLSLLIGAVAGKGVFYYAAMASILLVLALSANTAFADFPRLCQIVARDGYLPLSFASRGRRLVYSQGIYALTFLSGALLVVFGGVTDRLIPLYAVGAFLAFTLSQAGMVAHWSRVAARSVRPGGLSGGAAASRGMLLNGAGALATGLTAAVALTAKFAEGAWITALLIPAIFLAMRSIRRHYDRIHAELASPAPLDLDGLRPPLVIVPILGWNKASKRALRFAFELSLDVEALHVKPEEPEEDLRRRWAADVEAPAAAAGRSAAKLKIVSSPYRHVLAPIRDHVLDVADKHPDRRVAVVIPEIFEDRWYNYLLHAQRAHVLKALLYFGGNGRVIVVTVPWYLGDLRSRKEGEG